ncbi:MAG: M15 family metallopeptidase [Lachnospiraceae bacterium]|nr:M15 family metallopeptidase [Lachnospiraceae bacterium]
MGTKFFLSLLALSEKSIFLKLPLFIIMGVYLFFYYIFLFLYSNMRKIAGTAIVVLVFVVFTSFSFSREAEVPKEPESVHVTTDEGDIVVEELDIPTDAVTIPAVTVISTPESGERDAAVSENDLIAALNAASRSGKLIENDFQADENARIFDEEKGYVRASYKDDWSLILINKEHHIPDDYEFELETIRGQIKSDVRVIPYVLDMVNGAREDGVTIMICSPYRSDERQEVLFKRKQRQYMRKGYSEEEAYNLASQTIAIPGTSEHQVGLAFDFISDDYKMLNAGFAETKAGKWLKEHCAEYGFILRYPLGKEKITEIEFEPWHYRYVGRPAAEEIMKSGLCLEEYVEKIGAME